MKLKQFLRKVINKAKRITTKDERLNTYHLTCDLTLNEKGEINDKGNQKIHLNSVLSDKEMENQE